MVKQRRKKSRRQKRKSHKRNFKKMIGGNFTDIDKKELSNIGFSPQDIEIISTVPVGIDIIKMTLNQINPETENNYTPSEIIDIIKRDNEINNTSTRAEEFSNNEVYTTDESFNDSFDDTMSPLNISDLNVDDKEQYGGKKRKTRKRRKGRKSRKQRGGVCYGNGVGANNYDPNFSIYNTRELSLFPYRPTN